MMEGKLRVSAVSFDAATHTYTCGGRELEHVTPIIEWVYPGTYEGIDPEILKAAQERGSSIHNDCQMSDAGFEIDTEEVRAYQRLKALRGLESLTNEWLVDWQEKVASKIDVIFADMSIADIKTTSSIHEEKVSLQLSIYAWMLEEMNEGLVVPNIYVIWLPKQRYGYPVMRALRRIPSKVCMEVVLQYLQGKDNKAARLLLDAEDAAREERAIMNQCEMSNLPAEFVEAEKEVARLEMEAKAIKERSEALREGLLRIMEETGTKKYEGEHLILTYKDAYERESLDASKVKSLYPDVWQECRKVSKVKPSLNIKIK